MPRGREFKEEEVLDKAVDLFWKQGYHATSMQEVVDALGINRASLYNTFGDKYSLFEKALDRYRKTNRIQMEHFLESHHSVKEGLSKLFEMAIEQSVADRGTGCFVVNTATELLPGDEKICEALQSNKVFYETLFLDYLTKGIEKDQIPKTIDLRATASMLFTQYNGIKVVSKIAPDSRELMSSVRLMLSLLDK